MFDRLLEEGHIAACLSVLIHNESVCIETVL